MNVRQLLVGVQVALTIGSGGWVAHDHFPSPHLRGCRAVVAYANYEVGKASDHDVATLRLAADICKHGVSPDM